MSARDAGLEIFLARLYVDDALYARFLADPEGTARRADLTAAEVASISEIDRVGLELARASHARKRQRTHIKEKRPMKEAENRTIEFRLLVALVTGAGCVGVGWGWYAWLFEGVHPAVAIIPAFFLVGAALVGSCVLWAGGESIGLESRADEVDSLVDLLDFD